MAAMIILAIRYGIMMLENTYIKDISQAKILGLNAIQVQIKVSTNCAMIVEILFLSRNFLFQCFDFNRWKTKTSTLCHIKYATIDAIVKEIESQKIVLYEELYNSYRSAQDQAGTNQFIHTEIICRINNKIREKKPSLTNWKDFFFQ